MEWTDDHGVDVTSAFKGITTPIRELYDEIHKRGWTVSKVDIKDGMFFAQAQNPYGEKVEKTGNTDATAVANLLLAIMRKETIRYMGRTASWGQTWDDQISQIAHAYAEAPVYDPKAAGAWKELAEDMQARATAIAGQIQVEVVDEPEPYKDITEMCEDVRKNRHIFVSRANAHHPLWSTDQVVAYRLCRDVLGHCQAGGDYGWFGENRATAAMMPLLSPNAQKALFTESIGQAAYNNYYRAFGPQKVVFLDEHLADVQEEENQPGHAGIHPSQSVVPGMVPDMRVEKESSADHTDPNAGWSSGTMPLPDNAYLWIREQNGLDPIDFRGVRDAASVVDTGWHGHHHPDGQPDLDTQRHAVVNALRAVALAPRKNARWHATHYQHVLPISPTVSDPQRYWEVLENHRDHHNMARGLPPAVHRMHYEDEMNQFRAWIKALHPHVHDGMVDEIARRELFHMLAEEEERLSQEDPDHKLSAEQLEAEAHKAMKIRLRAMTKHNVNEDTDFVVRANLMDQPDPGVYGSFLASHVRPLGAISHHANDLLQAARDDVSNNKGRGHHFRKTVLGLGIPGIGPKEASFAWMLLQPHTSELAVLNPHMAEILGHRPEQINNRDYFKMERQLGAGRDAAGYGHVPLGQFGWALHDSKRGGPGHHEDLGHLRPLHPTPHDQIDWQERGTLPDGKWNKPYWWEATQEVRDQVGKDFDESVGLLHPSSQVPFQRTAARTADIEDFEKKWRKYTPVFPQYARKLAGHAKREGLSHDEIEDFFHSHKDDFGSDRAEKDFKEKFWKAYGRESALGDPAPWFNHPTEGREDVGAPGESIMAFIKLNHPDLTTEQIWELIEEAGKVK